MAELPKDLDEAITQSGEAAQAAIASGYTRVQVEFALPELKPQPVAERFIPSLTNYGANLKIYFPDAGAAAWLEGIGEKLLTSFVA